MNEKMFRKEKKNESNKDCYKEYIKIVLKGEIDKLLSDSDGTDYEKKLMDCFGSNMPISQIRKFFDILAYVKDRVDKNGYDSSLNKELFQMVVIVKNAASKNKVKDELFKFVKEIVKNILEEGKNDAKRAKELIDSFYLFMEFYVAAFKS